MNAEMSVKFLMVVVALSIGHGTICTAQSCTPFGNTDLMEHTQSSATGLFLDLQNPAPCSGTVTAWNYCFYRIESASDVNYIVDFVVYRRRNNVFYDLVDSRRVDMSGGQLAALNSDFNCTRISLHQSEMFEIRENDVLGACLNDEGNNQKMLDILAESVTNTLYITDGCTQSVPTIIRSRGLSTSPSFALHLFVDVTQPPVESPTNQPQPPPSEAATLPSPTNQPQPPPSEAATLPSPTNQPPPPAGGLSSGIVAAIVILVLALVVSAVVVVGLIVCFIRRQRHHQSRSIAKGANGLSAIDNVVYCVVDDAQLEVKVPEELPYEVPCSSRSNTNAYLQGQYDFDTSTIPVNGIVAPEYYSTIGCGPDYSQILEQNKEMDIYAKQSPYLAPATKQEDLYAQIKSYGIRSILREEVETVSHLGSGHFGNVDRGLWRSAKSNTGVPVEVALKSLTEGASDVDEVKFLQEAAIMAQFEHPNVISLYGVVTKGNPIMLVVELAHKGDLKECLTFMRPNSGDPSMPQQLLKYSQQVALGMHYLSSKGFVHRDLAARNILVSKNDICKVADFGMSRDLADETYYVAHGGMVPLKWTAPEALNYHKYSTASDVWSYGCLLYEIWSLGHKPFEGVANQEVMQKVNSGYRLPPPPGCPRVIYEMMIMNWNPDSSLRPGFRDLLLALLQNVEAVLAIPEDAQATHAQASVLGAPLEAGEQMYHVLQQTYLEQ